VRYKTTVAATIISLTLFAANTRAIDLKYSFGPQPLPGYTHVKPDDTYSPDKGYGFDLASKVKLVDRAGNEPSLAGFVTGQDNKPFLFSAKLAPGVYRVTVTLGDSTGEATTTVKSETRRLMLESVTTAPGEVKSYSFLVHVRVPQIPESAGGGVVSFKPRERDPILFIWEGAAMLAFKELDWDEKLTLEFSDRNPCLDSIEITDAQNPTTVYLVGDSTMTDQMMEPWAGWGMMLPRFFNEPLVVANYAECGESAASFISEKRWPKLLSEIHKGDYVFIQFGINDQGMRGGAPAFKQLFERYVDDTLAHGAIPVLVTSQNLRRSLGADGKAVQTLRDFPDAMRQVAKEKNVALIDLNAMSMTLYEAEGMEGLKHFFVEGTHQQDYGAYELCKCVVQGIIDDKLPIAAYLTADFKYFDPAKPDKFEDFHMPQDPQLDPARPGGPGAPNGQGAMAAPRATPRAARGTTRPTTRAN